MKEEENITIDEKLVEAFHLMYDPFPEPVILAHRSKKVIVANPASVAVGRDVGTYCFKNGPSFAHRRCQAVRCVKEQKTKWHVADFETAWGAKPVMFWMPIPGFPDFFIHFPVGRWVDYTKEPS